jgi:protein SCO1/2
MNSFFSRFLLSIGLLVSFASTAPAAEVYDVTGIIRGPLKDGRITIAHREIPGFMAAMTMSFVVVDSKEAASLKIGDEVHFQLRESDGDFVASKFSVTGHTAPGNAAPAKIARLKAGSAIPAFNLIDEQGRPLTAETIRGRHTVVTFIFTRCPVPEFCPAMAAKFAALQRSLAAGVAGARHVRLLSVTLDPEFDRPEILAAYGAAVGANPAIWNFATGTKAEIEVLSRAFSVFAERNGVTLDHTLCTALIGPDGTVIDIWRGGAWKNDELLAAIKER